MGLALVGRCAISEVAANDDKVFAPQYCVPVGDEGTPYEGPYRIFNGSVRSLDDEPVDYLCPLIRDVLKEGIERVWVRVKNNVGNSNDEETQCCIYSFSPLAESSDFECGSAVQFKGNQSIEISGVKSWDNGYYVLRCTLETDERIYSYRSSEP